MMQNQSDTIRLMAQKYLQLAKTTNDQKERLKFLSYAAFYADLAGHRQGATAARETGYEKKGGS